MRTPDAPYYYFESEHSFDIAKWYPEEDRAHAIKLRASIWWKWEDTEHSAEFSYEEAEEAAKSMVTQLNEEYRKEQRNA